MLVIKGGHVIDPGNINGKVDLVITNGKITEIKPAGTLDMPGDSAAEIIDAAGKIVCPGLIDMHVHLREPGHEYKETIETGCRAAVCGGFTSVCAMPNTDPVNDNQEVTEYILKKAAAAGLARVYPVAAISKGLLGKALSEYGDLKEAGAVALTDDGQPVSDSMLMRRAMEYAKGFCMPIISHCEEISLAGEGVMNEGPEAVKMGLAGIPNAVESIMVMRDIALCELTGSALHIAHVSTRESVNAIRDAKKRGVRVTAETAPHYFSLTDEAVYPYNTNTKMNPPLRSQKDREAVRKGLSDSTIDVIATDHAPHSHLEKDVEFNRAANGIIGLETALPLGLQLVEDNVLTIESLIKKMSKNPARVLGINSGIIEGGIADITIFDPGIRYTLDAETFCSKSRNTPFNGWKVKGRAIYTIVGGKIVYRARP